MKAFAATESSPRELSHVQQVTGCFARVKSSTAGSVSLSDWLGHCNFTMLARLLI